MGKKSFFSGHSKASALVVSLMIHAVLIVSALFFVAVTGIQKSEAGFEAGEINRPKMKLRKQIVLKPDVAKITPAIKLPQIGGVKGGLGAGSGGGFGAAASLGVSMPAINLFNKNRAL